MFGGEAIRALYVSIAWKGLERFLSGAKRIEAAGDDVVRKYKRFEDTLESIGKKMTVAGASLTALAGGIVYEAGNVEEAMMQLRKVMLEDTDFERIQNAAEDMAKYFGRSVQEILAAMELWARQGKKQEEVIKLTRAALTWAVAEGLNAAEATDYLTSTLNQLSFTADDASHIVDALNEVSNNFATDSRKLAASLVEVGAQTKAMGVSFEEVIGYITALHSAGYDAGEAGTFLAYTLSKLYDPEVVKHLRAVGIEVRNADGSLRDASEILGELAARWKNLTREQQLNIASSVTIGGRITMMNALMEKWDIAMNAAEAAMNSFGSAQRECERALTTFNTAVKRAWVNIRLLAAAIGETVIPFLKPLANLFTLLLQKLMSLPKSVKLAIGAFVTFGGALFLGIGSLILLRASLIKTISTLLTLAGVEGEATLATLGLSGAFKALAISAGGILYRGLLRGVLGLRMFLVSLGKLTIMMLTNPITWVIFAIIGAVLLLQDVLVKGFKNSYIGRAVYWLADKLSFLTRVFRILEELGGKIISAFKKLAGVFVAAKEKIAGFASKLGVLKYALLPLAAPALAVYLIKHWDELKSVVAGVGAAVKSKLAGAFAAVKGAAEGVGAALRRRLEGVASFAKKTRTFGLLFEIGVAVRERRLKAALASLVRLPVAYAADAASAMRFLAERIGRAFGVPDLVPRLKRRLTAVLDALRAFAAKIPAIIKEALTKLPALLADAVKKAFGRLGRLGDILARVLRIEPLEVAPKVLKPELDRKYYEEGSVRLKLEAPPVPVEVKPPDVSAVAAAFEKLRHVATTLAVGVPVALGGGSPVTPHVAPTLTVAPKLEAPPVPPASPSVAISPTLNFSANVEVHVEKLDAGSEEDVRSLAEQIWVAIRDRQTRYVLHELRRMLRSV